MPVFRKQDQKAPGPKLALETWEGAGSAIYVTQSAASRDLVSGHKCVS